MNGSTLLPLASFEVIKVPSTYNLMLLNTTGIVFILAAKAGMEPIIVAVKVTPNINPFDCCLMPI
ncbi:hypothetical protein D3C81_2300940 [compost metagenome]